MAVSCQDISGSLFLIALLSASGNACAENASADDADEFKSNGVELFVGRTFDGGVRDFSLGATYERRFAYQVPVVTYLTFLPEYQLAIERLRKQAQQV